MCGRNGGVSQVVFKRFQGPLTVYSQPGWQFNTRAWECNAFGALWCWASQDLSGGTGDSKAAQKCTESHLVLEIKSGPNYSRYALQTLCYLPFWEPGLIAQPFYILQAMWEKLANPLPPLLRIWPEWHSESELTWCSTQNLNTSSPDIAFGARRSMRKAAPVSKTLSVV